MTKHCPDNIINTQNLAIRQMRGAILAATSSEKINNLRYENTLLLRHIGAYFLHDRAQSWSAKQRLSKQQQRHLVILLILSGFAFGVAPYASSMVLVVFLQVFFIINFVFRGLLVYQSASSLEPFYQPPLIRRKEANLPLITILVPLYREANAVPHILHSLEALDYPSLKLDIKLLLEADDADTIRAVKNTFTASHYDIILVPDSGPRTKPKACNHGLWTARGSLIVIYDAEDRPEPDQLRKAVQAFDSGSVKLACVQARLNFYNRSRNWLTRLFAIEYALLFDFILPGLASLNAPIPLGGTSNIFRTRHVLAVGGWDPYNVTEDADLGMRLADAGYEIAMIDSTTWEEAVFEIKPWLRQRSRWLKGYLQTWLVHMRRRSRQVSVQSIYRSLVLHVLIGGSFISALINPILWMVFILSWTNIFGEGSALFPPAISTLAVSCFLIGNFLQLYLFISAPLRREWLGYLPYVIFAPIYWALQSIAAWIALWQIFIKPFYWEKTDHFTDKNISTQPAASTDLARGIEQSCL